MLGFSISLSGIQVGLRNLDISANNLANVTTPSFKASRADSVDLTHGGASVGSIKLNFNPGPLEITDGGFSLAVDGDGFFRVQTPQGERFTRAGSFRIDGSGTLVTAEGHPVQPGIEVPTGTRSLSVSPNGMVSALLSNGQTVALGQVDLARFANTGGLSQQGGNLFSATPASGLPLPGLPGEGGFGSLMFGAVEGSNVDLATEMVNQIVSSAQVKANVAALRAKNKTIGTILDLKQ